VVAVLREPKQRHLGGPPVLGYKRYIGVVRRQPGQASMPKSQQRRVSLRVLVLVFCVSLVAAGLTAWAGAATTRLTNVKLTRCGYFYSGAYAIYPWHMSCEKAKVVLRVLYSASATHKAPPNKQQARHWSAVKVGNAWWAVGGGYGYDVATYPLQPKGAYRAITRAVWVAHCSLGCPKMLYADLSLSASTQVG
jgi:hypothetical protein